jgi:hypothetical protein
METNANTTEKKSTWKSWVIGIVLGVGMILLGTTGVIKDENVNSTLIYVGASQAASGAAELNPELAPAFDKAADIIDAAIQARTTDPKELVDIITTALKEHTAADVRPVVEAAVLYVNQSYTTSETEEIYHKKLQNLASGFRSGVYSILNVSKDDALEE